MFHFWVPGDGRGIESSVLENREVLFGKLWYFWGGFWGFRVFRMVFGIKGRGFGIERKCHLEFDRRVMFGNCLNKKRDLFTV